MVLWYDNSSPLVIEHGLVLKDCDYYPCIDLDGICSQCPDGTFNCLELTVAGVTDDVVECETCDEVNGTFVLTRNSPFTPSAGCSWGYSRSGITSPNPDCRLFTWQLTILNSQYTGPTFPVGECEISVPPNKFVELRFYWGTNSQTNQTVYLADQFNCDGATEFEFLCRNKITTEDSEPQCLNWPDTLTVIPNGWSIDSPGNPVCVDTTVC